MLYLLEPVVMFLDRGGLILWGLLGIAIVLWSLIIERFWFLLFIYPNLVKTMHREWATRSERASWGACRVRDAMLSKADIQLRQTLPYIRALIVICPLCGLLGTVTGMIEVFDVMTVLGTGNPRAMAAGVSKATIPTMAGMVVALSGLFFRHFFERKRIDLIESLTSVLRLKARRC